MCDYGMRDGMQARGRSRQEEHHNGGDQKGAGVCVCDYGRCGGVGVGSGG